MRPGVCQAIKNVLMTANQAYDIETASWLHSAHIIAQLMKFMTQSCK
jgi:hypothetical protein